MTKDKEPSIFDDRGTIGSSDELDEYGVWVKSEPQDLSSYAKEAKTLSADSLPDLSMDLSDSDESDFEIPLMDDLEEADLPEFDSGNDTDNGLIDSASVNDDIIISDSSDTEDDDGRDVFNFGDFTNQTDLVSEDFDSNVSMSEDDSSEPLDNLEISKKPDVEDGGDFTEISMDDFIDDSDSEDSPSVGIKSKEQPPVKQQVQTAQSSGPDLSTQLLMKIAEELSSIRTELKNLKKEFSGLRAAAPSGEVSEEKYYDEEDDEKISLTGDELNNILNTANFTEQAGADASIELSENLDLEEADDSISFDSGLDIEMNLEESGLEDGTTMLGNTSDLTEDAEELEILEEPLPDFDDIEDEELKTIREKGAEPMTFPPEPEDSEYLEEESILDDDFSPDELSTDELSTEDLSTDVSEDSLDLSEAVIDEPDLSSGIQDNPLEEPSLDDISISLDLSDLDSEDLSGFNSLQNDTNDEIEEPLTTADLEGPLSTDDLEGPLSTDDLEGPLSADDIEEPLTTDDIDVFETETSVPDMLEEIEELQPEDNLAFDVDMDSLDSTLDSSPEIEQGSEDFQIPELTGPEVPEPELLQPKPVPAEYPAADKPGIPTHLRNDLKTVLSYMDQLLEALPDDKIEEFARSNYYETYKKLFRDLGLA